MKIAYLLYWFPKLSETFIYDEIQWIRQEGHEVFVIASREVTEIPRVHFDGYKRIADLHDSSLIDLLRKLGVEHVHSHFGRFFYQQGALDLVKVLGVPFTLTVHMSEIWGMKALSVGQWRSVWDNPFCRAIIAITDIHKKRLEELGVRRSRIAVIPCSVNLEMFTYRTNPVDTRKVLSVGRLEPMKGHDVLIKAFRAVQKELLGAELWIIGASENRYGDKLMELTSGNDHVRFLGAQPRSVVVSELRSAQIFSLPCIVTPPEWPRAGRHDGLPLAILEAMAVGVPVISSSIGGIPAAISNNVTGILCRPGNVDDVAEALMDLMLDCGKRERLSGDARAYVEMQHNPNRNTPRLIETMRGRLPN